MNKRLAYNFLDARTKAESDKLCLINTKRIIPRVLFFLFSGWIPSVSQSQTTIEINNN